MIFLEHLWKSHGRGRNRKDVLVDIDTTLDFSSGNIGILGTRKSGKTTLLNVIAGVTQPDHGRVKRRLRVSWPLTWRGLGRGITGDDQVAFLARLYQADRRATLRYVAELSGLGQKLYALTDNYSAGEKDRLMLALALGLDFDVYIIDENLPGVQPDFKAAYEAAWSECLQCRRTLVASSKPAHLVGQCGHAAILDEGKLSAVVSIDDAVGFYRKLARDRRTKK